MKNTLLLLLCALCVSSFSYGQLIITEIADPNDNALARYVEIYNVSGAPVDVTGWELRRWTNATATPQATGIDLSSVGTLAADGFILVAASAAEFTTVYGFAPDIDGGTAGAADSNGDDQIAIFDAADNTIDIFGVPGEDGTGTCHEFEDGRAERIASVTASNPVWTESEWNVYADSPVTGCTSHSLLVVNAGDGVFDPGVWIGANNSTPSISANPSLVGGFVQFVGSPSPELIFDVSGANLSDTVFLTVTTGPYEISLTSGSGFGTNANLVPTGGTLASTMIYVRLNGSTPANPVTGQVTITSAGVGDVIVDLDGQILNPDPVVFTSEDTLSGFSHFVGTPSAEQSFDVSGNFLQGDISVDVSNSVFEIALDAAGPYTSNLSIPASNMVTSDPSSNWVGYMNVFELPENGGAFQFGGPWGLPDLKTTLNTGSNSITLQPNFNTYNDNQTDGYWVNQTTLEGNKFMEANTFVEPGAGFNDQGLIFTGNVTSFTLDTAQYDAKCFIKALDPNAGYADAFGGSKTFDLPMSGSFSVSATAAELPAGLIIQYGFMVTGRNANPADELTLGSVEVEGVSVSTSVPVTPVYVRLNGPVLNYNQVGEIYVTSTLANVDTLALNGETLDYIPSSIGAVTTNDANGVADSLGVYVELSGTVHCIDFDGNAGYSFTIIDDNNDGINVFNFNDVSNYVVAEGDILTVTGYIEQYNGLTEIVVDSILVTGTGPVQTPTVVTALDESTESQWVTLENLNFVTPIATFPTGSNNIDVTNGTDVFTIRVDADTDIPGSAAPQVSFSVTGVGGQFDNSSPYDGGYQLFPCSVASFVPSCTTPDNTVTLTDGTLNANATGANVMYAWIDCATNEFLASTQEFTPTQTGEYAVIVMDGECSDTSDCQFVDLSNLENISLFNVSVTPNPFNENLNIQSTDMDIQNLEVYSMEGKIIYSNNKAFNSLNINTNNWKTGVYILKLQNINGTVRNVKVLKN